MKKTILIVDDNKKIRIYNKRMLEEKGFTAVTAMSLAEAGAFMKQQTPDAVILDTVLPDGCGLDFLRELRRVSDVPVLILSGFENNKDILTFFESGCDDYVVKPYTFEVLFARLQRLLHRAEKIPEKITKGLLTLNPITGEAVADGVNLLLTPKDFTLLMFFIQKENLLMKPDYIYETVWGKPMAGDSKALAMAISRLRKKLKHSGYTITMDYGNGYRFERGD